MVFCIHGLRKNTTQLYSRFDILIRMIAFRKTYKQHPLSGGSCLKQLDSGFGQTNGHDGEGSQIESVTFLETMADALAHGHNVEIGGFGSFQVRDYNSYVGRNPKSRKEIKVAPKKLPFFKAGKKLREQLNN